MKFNIGGKASFFKILLNDSEDYLRLPAAFAKKYLEKHNSNSKKQVFLKTKSNNVTWSVKYFKIEDGYYLVDGWLDFMKANRLHKGDFIVFWLLSSSSSKSKLTFQVFPYAPNGCLKLEHKPKHPSTSDDSGSRRLAVKEEEETSDTNEYSSGKMQQQSTNTMSIVVKKSYIQRLPLIRSFLEAKGVDEYGSVRLKNEEGKTWDVPIKKYGVNQERLVLLGGWPAFRKHHNIKVGNTCEFRHIKANLFHVRVVKKRGRTRSTV